MLQADNSYTASGADAELLRLAEQFQEINRAFRELIQQPGYSDAQAPEAALLARRKRCAALKVAEVIATTEEGRRKKAAVLLAVVHRNLNGNFGWDTAVERIGISLAIDLVGSFGAGEPRR